MAPPSPTPTEAAAGRRTPALVRLSAATLAAVVVAAGCSAWTSSADVGEVADAGATTATDDTDPAAAGSTTASAGDDGAGDTTGGNDAALPVGPEPTAGAPGTITTYDIEIVDTHPHDTQAYTQGLEVVGDLLLESTGLTGQSSLRLVDPFTGEPARIIGLDEELFGEGATVVGDEIWQLTWTDEQAIVYGLDDLRERRRVGYDGEGWGLCATEDRLVMSDGSSTLQFRDPATFDLLATVAVTDDAGPVEKLNELECVGDLVWANLFQSTRLVAIDPVDGRVVGEVDLAPIVPAGYEGDGTNVANGVAFDQGTGRFWLTGKRWPVVYEVKLVPSG